MVEFMKPFVFKNKYKNCLWFDDKGEKINYKDDIFRYIVFDNDDNNYFILGIRLAEYVDENNNPKLVEKRKGEKEITFIEPALFNYVYYVDTSKIFVVDKKDLGKTIDLNYEFNKDVNKLSKYYISQTMDGINECIFDKSSPYFSILKIDFDENNKSNAIPLYLSKTKTNTAKDFHYNNGIIFCNKILNEFFPQEKRKT